MESLEGRAVPTVFHVTNLAELQADIAAVNNTSGPNVIVLAPVEFGIKSELHIQNAENLAIVGTTSTTGTTEIVQGGTGRIFEIDGGSVTLSGMILSGGGAVEQGGAINAQDTTLKVENATIAGNAATQAGGGIAIQGGTLDVENSAIRNNTAGGASSGLGGGIAAFGAEVNLAATGINNNSAFGHQSNSQAGPTGAGGGLYVENGTLAIASGVVSRNTAYAVSSGSTANVSGGGVATSNTTVSVTKSSITNNTLNVVGNRTSVPQGAAFSATGGSLTISSSQLAGNLPGGRNEIVHQGAPLALKRVTVG
jgi:hypothetical protein